MEKIEAKAVIGTNSWGGKAYGKERSARLVQGERRIILGVGGA